RILVDVLHGMVRKGVGGVELPRLGCVRLVVPCELAPRALLPVTAGAADQPEILFESAIGRPVRPLLADVPLPGHRGAISGGAQRLRDGDAAVVQVALIFRDGAMIYHVPDARAVIVEAGQQGGSRGAAARRVVEL